MASDWIQKKENERNSFTATYFSFYQGMVHNSHNNKKRQRNLLVDQFPEKKNILWRTSFSLFSFHFLVHSDHRASAQRTMIDPSARK